MNKLKTKNAPATPTSRPGGGPRSAQSELAQPANQVVAADAIQTATTTGESACLNHFGRELLALMYSLSVRLGFDSRVHASDLPNSPESADALDCLIKQKIVERTRDPQWFTINSELARAKLHRLATWGAELRRLWVTDCVYAIFAMNLAFAAIGLFRLLTADFKELPQNAIAYLGDPVYIVIVTIITAFVFTLTGLLTWIIRNRFLKNTYKRLLDTGVRRVPFWLVAIECIPIAFCGAILGYFAHTFFPATLLDLWPFGLPLVLFAVLLAGLASLQRLWPYELQLASKPLRNIVLWILLILSFITTREFNSKLIQLVGLHVAPIGGTPSAPNEIMPGTPGRGVPREIRFVRLMCSFAFTLSLLWTSNAKLVRILSPWESLE